MTVAWHIDNLKVSHKKLSAIREFAALLNDKFGKETPISQSYRKKHEYLGMQMDYSVPSKVTISMEDYIRLILQEAPEDMEGMAAMPAGGCLFRVNQSNPNKSIFISAPHQVHIRSARSKTGWLARCLKNSWLLASLSVFLNSLVCGCGLSFFASKLVDLRRIDAPTTSPQKSEL